ncbi:MAG TPA: hypothetical protein VKX17_20785 [Planctomycetota bacterium]|nr:hypothetical protein [Planctomycetota bacterium]
MRAILGSKPVVRVTVTFALLALFASRVHAIDVMINVAGTGTAGYSGDGGPATSAQFNQPHAAIEDSAGNIYVADTQNHVVRRIDFQTQVVTTIAGNGTSGFSGDNGPATSAQLRIPASLTFDLKGNLYIVDAGDNRIRKVAPNGIITTFAGNGSGGYSGDGGLAINASLFTPSVVVVDSVTSNGNNSGVVFSQLNTSVIRRVDLTTNIITSICGNGNSGFSGDNGPAAAALVNNPTGIRFDSAGNLYVADALNERIRKITRSTGVITTIAGTGTSGFSGDNGPALSAQFLMGQSPTVGGDLALDASGNIFLLDSLNERVRYIDAATNTVTTIAGNGTAGYNGDYVNALSATLNIPAGIFVESNGNYLIADNSNNLVRRVVRNFQGLPLSISGVQPPKGGNAGIVTLSVIGSGFKDGATVQLRSTGLPTLTSSFTVNRFGLELLATFDLTGAALGVYDVTVLNPDTTSTTLPHAFTIAAATPPKLSVGLVGPRIIRASLSELYCAVVSNLSDTDMQNVEVLFTLPAYVTSATLVNPSSRPSLDSLLVPGVPQSALDGPLIPLKDGFAVDLVLPSIPAGGSGVIPLRVTASNASNFTNTDGLFGATAFYSSTDYANTGVAFDSSVFTTHAKAQEGRTQAQNDCAVKQAQLAVDLLQKAKKIDKNSAALLKAQIGKGFPGVTNLPPGNDRDPCHNSAAQAARIQQASIKVFNSDPSYMPPLLKDVQAATQEAYDENKFGLTGLARVAATGSCPGGDSQASADPLNSSLRTSNDPNAKSGPSGLGAAHYIARGTPMTYLIECENAASATAPVQKLVVSDALDTTTLDLSSLNLGFITLADQVVEVPNGQASFTTDLDLRPTKNLIVHIVAGLQGGNTLTWTCTALDPATMQPTTDPTLGFLDPDKTPPQGVGTFLYTIKQKPNLSVGTVINNFASITFDTNSPIDTPTWSNTIALLGLDTDGDGFPDELEIAAGSDPNNPNSTPLGPGTFPLQNLTVSKLQMKLDFTSKHKDSLQMSGTFAGLPNGFIFTGKTAQVFVGGVYQRFMLNDKGQAASGKTAKFIVKQSKGLSAFGCTIAMPFASKLADTGFDGSADLKAPKSANRSVQVYVLFSTGFYGNKVPLSYGSKMGVSGSAVLSKGP